MVLLALQTCYELLLKVQQQCKCSTKYIYLLGDYLQPKVSSKNLFLNFNNKKNFGEFYWIILYIVAIYTS